MASESKHVRKFKARHANDGENVIAWADGYIGEMMGQGDKRQHNGSMVVTETRVAFYRSGLIGEVLETIPLKSLTSVERKSALGHRVIRLHTSHDDLEFKTFSKEGEAALVAAIEAGRSSSAPPPSSEAPATPPSSDDNLEKIKKLAELRDSGVLTDEEFNEKKQQLLADI